MRKQIQIIIDDKQSCNIVQICTWPVSIKPYWHYVYEWYNTQQSIKCLLALSYKLHLCQKALGVRYFFAATFKFCCKAFEELAILLHLTANFNRPRRSSVGFDFKANLQPENRRETSFKSLRRRGSHIVSIKHYIVRNSIKSQLIFTHSECSDYFWAKLRRTGK